MREAYSAVSMYTLRIAACQEKRGPVGREDKLTGLFLIN